MCFDSVDMTYICCLPTCNHH